jgi:hypothetical protein
MSRHEVPDVQFEGTMTLANNMEAILAEGNKITEIKVPNVQRLQLLDVAGNQLKTMPAELVQLPSMQSLHVDGNQLTALPSVWAVDNLRDFTAADNLIQVRLALWHSRVPAQHESLNHQQCGCLKPIVL